MSARADLDQVARGVDNARAALTRLEKARRDLTTKGEGLKDRHAKAERECAELALNEFLLDLTPSVLLTAQSNRDHVAKELASIEAALQALALRISNAEKDVSLAEESFAETQADVAKPLAELAELTVRDCADALARACSRWLRLAETSKSAWDGACFLMHGQPDDPERIDKIVEAHGLHWESLRPRRAPLPLTLDELRAELGGVPSRSKKTLRIGQQQVT